MPKENESNKVEAPKKLLHSELIDNLSADISRTVGNISTKELDTISDTFYKTLGDSLKSFNSNCFDSDGFIKRMSGYTTGEAKDTDVIKNILSGVKSDYIGIESINHSELLMRRDLKNICKQMPEMRDVVYIVRDSIIECNVSTGEVSRSIGFGSTQKSEQYESYVKEIENKHDLLMAIKNFIIPNTLMTGEMYIHIVPYSKLFAELEMIKNNKNQNMINKKTINKKANTFKESNLLNDSNLKILTESVSIDTKLVSIDDDSKKTLQTTQKQTFTNILENINIRNTSSVLLEEMGGEGFQHFVIDEYQNNTKTIPNKDNHFLEAIGMGNYNTNTIFNNIDEDNIEINAYKDIKGCYVKYLDSLRMIPIRMDRKVIGYYYVTTTMNLKNDGYPQPNGSVDISLQYYRKDKNIIDSLSNMIIKSFDKKMLEQNIQLKNEIADIVMAHKFSEGQLSFVYIPENEIVRMVINEDEEGKGHSILEPTLFPARMYLMLTLYNMIYTLNNNTTRIHYLRSSGLNKDYAAQIQRVMRKFQSRRITIDDIYSYTGALNKVGGMGEMVLPAGRADFKAIDTDTIEAVNNPISVEFLEQQRRQAISGTGVPQLMIINALDEVDFAKTLEMTNARFLSTVSSYKIDCNKGITKFYQLLLKYSTDIDDDAIQSFVFKFNAIKQQELTITAEMIQNFNTLVELVGSLYYRQDELIDEKNVPTEKMMALRKELAKEYLSQLDFDKLDSIVKTVNVESTKGELQKKAETIDITPNELDDVTGNKK